MGLAGPEADFFVPRYNIAPTQTAWIVVESEDGKRELHQSKWGLIPFWAKDAKIGNSLINARSETVATKPAFRTSFKKKRCLVLADGFYEWAPVGLPTAEPPKKGAAKQPMYIRHRGASQFVFGGLYDRWKSPEGEVESFSIITVEPNELMIPIHNRMPLMLEEKAYGAWLNPKTSPADLTDLLKPYPTDGMECYAVSTMVNSPRNIGAQCIEPMETVRVEK